MVVEALKAYIESLVALGDPVAAFQSFGNLEYRQDAEGLYPGLLIGEPRSSLTSQTCFSKLYVVTVPLTIKDRSSTFIQSAGFLSLCLEAIEDNAAILGDFLDPAYHVSSIRFTTGLTRKSQNEIWTKRMIGEFRVSKLNT